MTAALDLRTVLRKRGFSIYVDLKALAKGLRERKPFAAARRQAEYILIDARRVPLGFDVKEFERRHLRNVTVANGLGSTHGGPRLPAAAAPAGAPAGLGPPAHGPAATHRYAVRHDRQPVGSHQ